MKTDTDILDSLPFALIVVGAITIMVIYFISAVVGADAVVGAKAVEAGLQQCVVENKTVWQKECGK